MSFDKMIAAEAPHRVRAGHCRGDRPHARLGFIDRPGKHLLGGQPLFQQALFRAVQIGQGVMRDPRHPIVRQVLGQIVQEHVQHAPATAAPVRVAPRRGRQDGGEMRQVGDDRIEAQPRHAAPYIAQKQMHRFARGLPRQQRSGHQQRVRVDVHPPYFLRSALRQRGEQHAAAGADLDRAADGARGSALPDHPQSRRGVFAGTHPLGEAGAGRRLSFRHHPDARSVDRIGLKQAVRVLAWRVMCHLKRCSVPRALRCHSMPRRAVPPKPRATRARPS